LLTRCARPGTLGTHTLRRLELPSAASGEAGVPPGGAGPESVLFFQEQAVLRSVCFADQYLHASQRVTAAMRIHVQARARAWSCCAASAIAPRNNR
jgi:hypothetical protein